MPVGRVPLAACQAGSVTFCVFQVPQVHVAALELALLVAVSVVHLQPPKTTCAAVLEVHSSARVQTASSRNKGYHARLTLVLMKHRPTSAASCSTVCACIKLKARAENARAGSHLRARLACSHNERLAVRRKADGIHRVSFVWHELPERLAVVFHPIEVVDVNIVVHATCHHSRAGTVDVQRTHRLVVPLQHDLKAHISVAVMLYAIMLAMRQGCVTRFLGRYGG